MPLQGPRREAVEDLRGGQTLRCDPHLDPEEDERLLGLGAETAGDDGVDAFLSHQGRRPCSGPVFEVGEPVFQLFDDLSTVAIDEQEAAGPAESGIDDGIHTVVALNRECD
jgi:hypothetical protein